MSYDITEAVEIDETLLAQVDPVVLSIHDLKKEELIVYSLVSLFSNESVRVGNMSNASGTFFV